MEAGNVIILKEKIQGALKVLKYKVAQISIDHPKDEKYGDYTTNVAMILARENKENPNEIAQNIAKNICKDDLLDKIETVGGYINFYLKKEWLKEAAETINFEIEYRNKLGAYGKGKTMVIDYSAPNIAKPFGIGHLRSTNIGQAIYNIYRILGWKCIGDNHLGDWGTQFGKMITAIRKAMIYDIRFMIYEPEKKIALDEMSISDLEKLYVAFHKASETDESLLVEARGWFVKLEKGDAEAREIWQKCVEISLREFNRVYEMLGVKIDYAYGESFYEDKLEEIVKLFKKNKLTEESEGALIIHFDDLPDAILLKSDGGTNYLTRDLATIKFRMETWNPDLIIYEVGSEQKLHFQQVFAAAKMAGWQPNLGYKHVAHGLIRWKDGKFSTRKGQTIHMREVIEKAMERAKKIAPENTHEEIEAVAIGAIKFNDLAQDPTKDIIFDWDKVMSMEGNSGPYLQYTYARCISVLEKSRIREQKNIEQVPDEINEEELNLLREFYKFEEKILEAGERYNPAVIAEYLLTVARKYNEFYGRHRIVGEKEEVWRIFLTKTTSSVIKQGLALLGINCLEKM